MEADSRALVVRRDHQKDDRRNEGEVGKAGGGIVAKAGLDGFFGHASSFDFEILIRGPSASRSSPGEEMGSLPATDLETSMSLNQPMKADAHYFVKQISGEGPRGMSIPHPTAPPMAAL